MLVSWANAHLYHCLSLGFVSVLNMKCTETTLFAFKLRQCALFHRMNTLALALTLGVFVQNVFAFVLLIMPYVFVFQYKCREQTLWLRPKCIFIRINLHIRLFSSCRTCTHTVTHQLTGVGNAVWVDASKDIYRLCSWIQHKIINLVCNFMPFRCIYRPIPSVNLKCDENLSS